MNLEGFEEQSLNHIPTPVDRVGDRGAGYSNLGVWGLEAQTVLVHPLVLVLESGSQPDHVGQEDLLSLQSYGPQGLGREANEAMAAVSLV